MKGFTSGSVSILERADGHDADFETFTAEPRQLAFGSVSTPGGEYSQSLYTCIFVF